MRLMTVHGAIAAGRNRSPALVRSAFTIRHRRFAL